MLFNLIIFYYTKHGYHSKNMGHSLSYVKLSGLPTKKIVFKTLALSGAIAGIVGSIAVLGIHHRFTDGMLVQPLYAWTGIIAALLVNLNLWFVPLAGFFCSNIYWCCWYGKNSSSPQRNSHCYSSSYYSFCGW